MNIDKLYRTIYHRQWVQWYLHHPMLQMHTVSSIYMLTYVYCKFCMGCKDIFFQHFAELDSLFYKAQSEARLFSGYSRMLFTFVGVLSLTLLPGSEDLPTVLSCMVWYFSELCCSHQRVSIPRRSRKTCCQLREYRMLNGLDNYNVTFVNIQFMP